MRIFKKYRILFYIAFLIVEVNIIVNWQIITNPKIEVGQIWIYCYPNNNDDPFKDIDCQENKVVDIKNGYVNYEYGKYGMTNSSSKRFFLIGSHLKR